MLLLTSCSPYVRLADVKELPDNKPVIFGRINVIEKDHSKSSWGFCGRRIHIISDGVPELVPYSYCLTEEGSFYWNISPGGYMITHLSARNPIRKSFFGQVWGERGILARFVVPEASALIYIGTLIIKQEGDRYKMLVEDHYDQDLQRLKEHFTEISSPVAKSLMELR
jgi:hypothetical protein